MTKADLPKEEWNNINSDLLNWKGAVENNDLEVFETKSRSPNGKLPNIRNSAKGFRNTKTSESMTEKTKRISSLDYKSWENFDADEECKKMDLEEEQKQSVESRKNCPVSKIEKVSVSIEEVALESLGDISHLSANEREVMAVREKDIGNEFYNTNKVEDAIKHYTRSVHLCPTVAGLNNRAAAYLRQCSFNEALADLNQVLELDPKNVKARYRRAQSYQHKNMFREALDDINEVLMKEPTHLVARHIADQLRESVAKLPKMHRIKIKDKTTGKTMIKTITEKEMLSDYKNEDFIEVNDWGFPKIMCNCNGKHSNDPAIRHEDHMRYQHLNRQPQKKIAKVEPAKQETCAPIALPPKKLEILEVEKESQEAERMPGKKLEILEVEESPFQIESTNDSKSCVVADMRTTKSSVNPNPTKVECENTNSGQGSINDEAVEDKKPVCLDDQKTSLTNSKAVVNQRVTKRQRSTCSKTCHAVDPSKEQSPETTVDQMEKPGSEKPLKSGKSGKKTKDKKRHNSPKIENDKSLKTNANSIIKDTSSSVQSNRTTELLDVELLVPDRLKGVKTDRNARIQDNRLSKNGRIMQSCGCSEFFNEFKFKNDWLILKGPKSLEEKAKLLKSICPKHLIKAFGNSWEKEMLVDVILCLRNHFSPAEQLRAAEYLNIVPQLDRFKINSMFLTNDEKSLLRELVKNCSPHLDSSTVKAFS